VSGGYGGSEFGRNLVARDLGLNSLNILGQGMQGMSSIMGSTPLPRMTQASDILNVSGRDTMGLRSNERTQKLSMMTTAAQAPKGSDVWAKAITDMGGSLSGGGGGNSMSSFGSLGGILGILGGG
jgi:hypothetical protein